MALPKYASLSQRIWYFIYLSICSLVLFFLVSPLITIIPLSFSQSPFLHFTPEMLEFDPNAYSLRWYRLMLGDCSDPGITTVCSDRWIDGAYNSLKIAIAATILATALGVPCSLGLSSPNMPYRKAVMALMISPLIVPLIITASGMFMFFAKFQLVSTFTGMILAHTVLGIPFVVITVTASLVGFDHNLLRAAASLGGGPIRNFFKIQFPLITPGVISGSLFAFIASFDEVVIVLFIGGQNQITLPRQMWSGIRQEISPTILSVATILVVLSILLLTAVELLRRRSDKLRGL